MPAVRTKRQFTMADIAKSRARARLNNKGLSSDLIDLDAIESAIKQNDSPDIEMIDEEIDRLIAIGLESSCWATKGPAISVENSTPSIYAVEKPKSTDRVDLPLPSPTPAVQIQQHRSPTNEEPTVVDLPISHASPTTSSSITPQDTPILIEKMRELPCPPELLAVVEAEKRRAAQTAANIEVCTVVMNSVETALAPLATGIQNDFVVSLKVYLRSAIAHFLRSGTAAAPPTLPSRPSGPPPAVPIIKNTARCTPPAKVNPPSNPKSKSGGTWVTVALKGHQNSPATASTTQNAPLQRTKNNLVNHTASSGPDERLFLRIDKNHEWRLLGPSGVREILCEHLSYTPSDITHITRTPTGFALTVKGEETRQKILNDSDGISTQGAKLEPAPDLITYRIATVPVALRTSNGSETVDDTNLASEIVRVTNVAPKMVRVHGKTRVGAPYRSWLAHFPRDQAPRPGFRLFDESGVAVLYKPRRSIQQCKRCYGFHATHGCSRAPACENCSSTMHSINECKAPSKCRNCGGPHRSDSRNCLARPSRSGPASKDQLKTIRQMGQREYHAKARAEAAVIRAEVATTSVERLQSTDQNNLQAIIPSNEMAMSEAPTEGNIIPETQL
ncbi:putative eka-like protein [Erysiphe necator]|uniref:Putative eka-like protein n=1 Tax=Uncinula necator TaxID=52586 RepID=A0A0B1PBS3_UNCNE|nr:putative eka-like protein [Erysiphe necator]